MRFRHLTPTERVLTLKALGCDIVNLLFFFPRAFVMLHAMCVRKHVIHVGFLHKLEIRGISRSRRLLVLYERYNGSF